MTITTYRTSLHFPVKLHEVWTIRDGQGRTAETWRVTQLSKGEQHQWVTVQITDHGLVQ